MQLTAREITAQDIPLIIAYWTGASPDYLVGMGVDLSKMPSLDQWENMLNAQLAQPYPEKQAYATIWELDGKPVGHCNVNKIQFGDHAYMHLHLWKHDQRHKGVGAAFIRESLPYFFNNLQLKKVYCEPYALNPAPNKVLAKAGFTLTDTYTCIPGSINFEQEVNLWEISL